MHPHSYSQQPAYHPNPHPHPHAYPAYPSHVPPSHGYPSFPQPNMTYAPAPYQPPPPPQQQPAQQGMPYIGARISLISNMNIRYEGILYTIDTKNSTVALQHVQCFGTEDRRMENGAFVPPSSEIYEFIVFGGKDIKDLHVCEPSHTPALSNMDPAVLSMKQPPAGSAPAQAAPANSNENTLDTTQTISNEPVATTTSSSSVAAPPVDESADDDLVHESVGAPDAHGVEQRPLINNEWQQQGRNRQNNQRNRNQHQSQHYQGRRDHSYQQHHDNSRHTVRIIESSYEQPRHGVRRHEARGPQPTNSQEEFDFDSANARFNKDDFQHQLAAKSESKDDDHGVDTVVPSYSLPTADFPSVTKKYDKSKSFFDELTTDKGSELRNRRMDAQTFGQQAAHYRSKHGRGGGYRGGRGRGGYHQGGAQWRAPQQ